MSLGLLLKVQWAVAKHHSHSKDHQHHHQHKGHKEMEKGKKSHSDSCNHSYCRIGHQKGHGACKKGHGGCGWRKWKKPLFFFGDMRLRKQTDFNTVIDEKFTEDFRTKFQYRLRMGAKYKLNRHLKFVLRFRSKSQNYHSTSHNFGILDVNKYSMIGIDQVYGEYNLFGKKDDHLKNSKFNLNIKVGKFLPPLWNQSGVYLDKDIQFDGWAVTVPFFDYFSYSLAHAMVRAEKNNSGFTSDLFSPRGAGDFFLTNQLKTHFSYKMSDFGVGFVMGHMDDGKKSKNEVIPIALADGTYRSFESEQFYMLSARWKNKAFPVHFSVGGEYLMSSADNGDKDNSRGFVLLTKAKYKKFIVGLNYYDVGDASAPFIAGDSVRSEEEMSSLGEFFTQDSFYSINKAVNQYSAGVVGFTGFLTQLAWKFSDQAKLNLNLYILKSKSSNRFLAHKTNYSESSLRTRFYLDIKF